MFSQGSRVAPLLCQLLSRILTVQCQLYALKRGSTLQLVGRCAVHSVHIIGMIVMDQESWIPMNPYHGTRHKHNPCLSHRRNKHVPIERCQMHPKRAHPTLKSPPEEQHAYHYNRREADSFSSIEVSSTHHLAGSQYEKADSI